MFTKGDGILELGNMQPLPTTEADGVVWFDNPVEGTLSGAYVPLHGVATAVNGWETGMSRGYEGFGMRF